MKDTTITFRLTDAEKKRLEFIAKRKDIPMSQLIREAIKEIFQKEE